MTRLAAWNLARDLVVQEGLTYAEVARRTGIPLSTIQKRATQEGWQGERETGVTYADQIRLLKRGALDRAKDALLAAKTPQELQAAAQLTHVWRGLEQAYPEHRYASGFDAGAARELLGRVVVRIVEWFADHDPTALAALQPHLEPLAADLEQTLIVGAA